MATLNADDANSSLTGTKRKSVQIITGRTEVISIEEKHGPLYNAIPCMPLPLAVVCCILNIFIPGIGTLISSFNVFCGGTTRIARPVHAWLLNLLAALLQMLTFILIVGWIWSIIWGMTFVQISLARGEEEHHAPYYVRRQSSIE